MNKKILIKIMKVLAIIAICIISFIGIYVKENGQYKNIVKKYEESSDLTGYRELVLEVSDATVVLDSEGKSVGNTDNYTDETISQYSYQKSETKVNSDEAKNIDNFQKVKSIIQKRLEGLGVTDYNISIDEETGKMFLRLAEDEETDHAISNILQVGKFQIRDSEDESNVLISGSDLKKVSSVYNTTENGTTVYLQIELNKDATKKFADITENEYKTIENTTSENTTAESEENSESSENEESSEESKETQKQIVLAIDDNKLITTSFEDPIKDGIIDLSMGNSSKDADKISENLKSASTIALILNSGEMPLTYKVTQNQYVKQNIFEQNAKNMVYIAIGILAILSIYMILKFKTRGLLGAVSFIGYIALYLLLIRYTNVVISLNSIAAVVVMSIIAYLETIKLLKNNEPDSELRKKQYTKNIKTFISKIIPVAIISIVFSFMKWNAISSFGMIAFWGLALAIIYNLTIARKIID